MKVKRLQKIKINCYTFNIVWSKEKYVGGSFSYADKEIVVGVNGKSEEEIFMVVCHEVMEIIACEMNVRMSRPDCPEDYIFVYDHRQYETMMNMFSSVISQFV